MQAATALWLVVMLGAGCHNVFQLDEVSLPDGGPDDGAMAGCWNPALTTDEDSDEAADGCDGCPADGALSTDVDVDGDGIPDTCDPATTTLNAVVDFDGFEVDRGWEPQSGNWQRGNGRLRVVHTVQARAELSVALAEDPRVDMIFDTLTNVGVYMMVGAAGVEMACLHEKRSGSPDSLVLRIDNVVPIEMPLDDGAAAGRLRLGIDADGIPYCHGTRGTRSATVMGATNALGRTTSRIGLIGVDSEFLSVTVFGKR